MKYEKYLKQIADGAATGLYWCGVHADLAKEMQHGDSNIFRMVGFVEHCLFSIYWQAKKGAWMREAVKVPKKFVEESRRTTALAVLNEWKKKSDGE